MTLPSSGSISMDQVRKELGITGSISLNDSRVRALAGKPSGAISMGDLRGKSAQIKITQEAYYHKIGFTEYIDSRDVKVFENNTGWGLSEFQIKASKHSTRYDAAFIMFTFTSASVADKVNADIKAGKYSIELKSPAGGFTVPPAELTTMHPSGGTALQVQFKNRQQFFGWFKTVASKGPVTFIFK